MKIESGKFYKTRDGRKVGPIAQSPYSPSDYPWRWDAKGFLYTADGKRHTEAGAPETDLIAEWTEIDLSNPLGQVFGLMPPETQEAMKAHGGPWERYMDGQWCSKKYPQWESDIAYRVKPAPIRETVKRSLHGETFMGYVAIDLVDGEPDWSTMRKWSDAE